MREIKFRGKRVDNGEWEYGYYFVHLSSTDRCPDMHCIYDGKHIEVMEYHEVHPDTVGQYFDDDKDGVEIYEGSVVMATWFMCNSCKDRTHHEKAVVVWYSSKWCIDMSPFYPDCKDGWIRGICSETILEVIHTIHDKENENGKR